MTSSQRHTFTINDEQAGMRLDQVVAQTVGALSRTRVQKLIASGDVCVNDGAANASYSVSAGDVISVLEPPPVDAAPKAQDIPLDVVFEDDDLLVINKAAGMAVHPGKGVPDGTLVNALLGRPHSVSSIGGVMRPGIVHRLDKDTTGLLIVAKTDSAHLALSEALAAREISRRYLALALRNFQEDGGTVEASVGRNPKNRLKMAVRDGADTREARTHWRVLDRFRGVAQIECKLDTGRTHQIRVHMAHIGHPILGDETYGGGADLAIQLISPYDTSLRAALKAVQRQMLHAHDLKFKHPRTGEAMHFKQPPPRDFQAILERLRQADL